MNTETEVIPTVLYAGIDAVVFTIENHTDEAKWIHSYFQKEIHRESEAGNDVKEINPQQFRGLHCGHYRWGDNGKRLLFEAKGNAADEVSQIIKESAIRIKTTRLDWCVDFRQTQEATTYTRKLRGAFNRTNSTAGAATPTKSTLYESRNGADSYYIYTSDRELVARTYHKSLESPGRYPPHTWRHEIQLRHGRARDSFRMFRAAAASEWLARSHVIGFWQTFGMSEEWMQDTEPCRPRKGVEKTDTQKRLEWFERTALPVLHKLADSGVDVVELLKPLHDAGHMRLSYRGDKALNPRRKV
jgi:hypothetical protein